MLIEIKEIRQKGQVNKLFTKDIKRHPEATRAQALRCEPYPFNASVRWPKNLSTNKYFCSLLKLVRNDMNIKNETNLEPYLLKCLLDLFISLSNLKAIGST